MLACRFHGISTGRYIRQAGLVGRHGPASILCARCHGNQSLVAGKLAGCALGELVGRNVFFVQLMAVYVSAREEILVRCRNSLDGGQEPDDSN